MDNIVKNFFSRLQILLTAPNSQIDTKVPIDTILHKQFATLAAFLKNFPEMAVTVLSYELGDHYQLPEGYTNYLPQWQPKETFLSFLIKYASFVYNYTLVYIFEYFVKKNETPIFIEYNGEIILLSAYNEIVIVKAMIKQLEETLQAPEQFLTKMYPRAIWSIFSHVSSRLLNLPNEPNQKSYKFTLIESLKSLCYKALQVFPAQNDKIDAGTDHIKVIYLSLGRILETEIVLKTKEELNLLNEPPKGLLSSKEDLKWVSSLLKEQYYLGNGHSSNLFMNESVPIITNETILFEENILKDYSKKSNGIAFGVLHGKFFWDYF